MRFLQSSDLHLGMQPDSDMPWGKDRAVDIKNSLSAILDKAQEISADCLFITGNLFHHQPLTRDLKEIDSLFQRIPKTQVVLISGTEDAYTENSALHSFHFSENVHWLKDGSSISFDALNTRITALSCPVSALPERLASLKANRTPTQPGLDPVEILLYHAVASEAMPEAALFQEAGFHYTAVGGFHNPSAHRETALVISGSPEPLEPQDTGKHGIYMGDISAITHKLQRLEFFPLSRVRYIPITVNVSEKTEDTELLSLLRGQLEKQGAENIYILRLLGKHNDDLRPFLSDHLGAYRILDILDETESAYDFSALYQEHATDLIGYYIRAFLPQGEAPEELSITERHALDYGLTALLRETKEAQE